MCESVPCCTLAQNSIRPSNDELLTENARSRKYERPISAQRAHDIVSDMGRVALSPPRIPGGERSLGS